ncbi:hypothetical protein [Thermincola potens]|uniref:Uncharacterized protein n=1 Tax=Thermincola potens (strain JR) TaxID=635013 RepID=D5XA73_THEPJ|nr:hypothetical protein [Thermincola potens]ADG83206.1 conserved hypothetical protein [Thermincola potens JR]
MNITLDLRPALGEQSINKLKDTIARLGPNDGLTLVLDAADAHEADRLTAELRMHGFDYYAKGAAGKTYSIIAERQLLQ